MFLNAWPPEYCTVQQGKYPKGIAAQINFSVAMTSGLLFCQALLLYKEPSFSVWQQRKRKSAQSQSSSSFLIFIKKMSHQTPKKTCLNMQSAKFSKRSLPFKNIYHIYMAWTYKTMHTYQVLVILHNQFYVEFFRENRLGFSNNYLLFQARNSVWAPQTQEGFLQLAGYDHMIGGVIPQHAPPAHPDLGMKGCSLTWVLSTQSQVRTIVLVDAIVPGLHRPDRMGPSYWPGWPH